MFIKCVDGVSYAVIPELRAYRLLTGRAVRDCYHSDNLPHKVEVTGILNLKLNETIQHLKKESNHIERKELKKQVP